MIGQIIAFEYSMPRTATRFFGECDYDEADVFSFPSGLPGFEDQHSFLFLKMPDSEPLMFLQSLTDRALCFILLPVRVIVPDFAIDLSLEERYELRLPAGIQPKIGTDVLCGALVCSAAGSAPTANLKAPIVVNIKEKIGMQVIVGASQYSCRHELGFEEPVAAC
jgi:flagellar assembly factor FliW